MQTDVWTNKNREQLRYDPASGLDLSGYSVEALDGSIGKIDKATYEAAQSLLIVDTGPWIFGRKVMIPAGIVDRVDEADEKVWVNRTKEQIKDAPEYTGIMAGNGSDEAALGGYDDAGVGFRDWDDTRM